MEIGQSMLSFQNLDFSQLISSMGPEMLAYLQDKTAGHEDFFRQLITHLLAEIDKQSISNPEITRPTPDPKGILTKGDIHPELAKKVNILLDEAHKQGLEVMVFEGFRSVDRQNQLYDGQRGVTQVTGGNSYHNYGLAVDIVFKDKNGNPSWAENHDWKKLGEIGKSLGLKWGGDFKTLSDRAHFEFHPAL